MNELVSIIMPSYNTASYIKESIDSVISQTYTNWELLIVDDCSCDNTSDIVAEYNDQRIKYFRNSINLGAAVSRNVALQKASGKWIAFLDSDDLWMPDKLDKQIRFMKKNKCYFSYTQYKEIDTNGRETGILVSGPKKITKRGMLCYCWPGCLTVMYDADIIGLIQIEDIKKNNDYAMWLKVSSKSDCVLINECLAKYRRGREGSVSTHGYFSMIKWHYRLFRNAEKQSIFNSLFNTCKNILFGILKKVFYVKGE